ncbi:MAG: hypothetical protein Q9226_001208 [Calogaya cf. arnoldii]
MAADRRPSVAALQHTKEFPCSWPSCPKKFNRKSDLIRHFRIHTNERPYTCAWGDCDKSFIQRSALTVHIRTHTGEKPHRCKHEGCGKKFSDSSSLARHRRIHTGSRPYRCPSPCGKIFCRKTTLTKHYKRYHPTKGDDTGMPDVEEEDDDGCADSDEYDSCSESEANPNPPATQMTRQSSYYGHHWPLPCETAQLPNPLGLQGRLPLRPKSTMDRVKHERPRSVSPQLIRSIPPGDGSTSVYGFPRGRTMSIQTQMDQDFNQIPIPNPYPQDPRVGETSSPCQYRMENNMESLTSPTTMQSSPTDFSEISSLPESTHSSLFFPGPTSQPYVPHEEPSSLGYQTPLPIEAVPQDNSEQSQYDLDSKSMIQMQLMYDGGQMAPQQQMIQPITYYEGIYQPLMNQYYGPAPAWLENIKPEDSWPGETPTGRLNTLFNWNH